MTSPIPAPVTNMYPPATTSEVSAASRLMSPSPAAASSRPTTGNILYRPVAVMARPDPIEAPSRPTIKGSVSSPEAVGDCPLTICRYCGRKTIAPNMATPTTKPARLVMTNVWFANRCGGMIGSRARRSCHTARASRTAAAAASA